MGKLENKVAIVTGGGGQIGQAVCRAFAREGAKVVLCGRTMSKLETVAKQIRDQGREALPIVCDVSKLDQVQKMVDETVKKYGTIDILCNMAVASADGPDVMTIEAGDELWWTTPFDTGPKGTWYCMKTAFPYMKEKGGRIINWGSSSGVNGAAGRASYGAAKEAIRGLTRAAAREWAKYNITVTSMLPLAIGADMRRRMDESPKYWKKITDHIILKRYGDPDEDVAPVVVFLASEDAKYITATSIGVDGGSVLL